MGESELVVVGDDQPADEFGDLGNDRVSAGRNHPSGNPISHSIRATGGFQPNLWTAPSMFAIAVSPYRGLSDPAELLGQPCRPKLSSGVGHNEQSATHVWGTSGARGDKRPLRIEPESVKVTEHPSEGISISKES